MSVLFGGWFIGGWVWSRNDSAVCAWVQRYYGQIMIAVQGILWLFIGYRLSRCASFSAFLSRTGLGRRPTLLGFLIALLLIAMECVQARLVFRHWSYPYHSQPIVLRPLPGLSALYEEIIMRGFIYRAFRSSYGVIPSTLLILFTSGLLHTFAFRSFGDVAVCFITWILLCQVRERSLSLWDCVLGHAAWNAVAQGDWLLCGAEMVIFLMFCRYPYKTGFGHAND